MTRGLRLAAVVAFAAFTVVSEGRAAEEIDAGDFVNPTTVTFDALGFGESVTDQLSGVDFNGSLFGSPPGAAGPVADDTVTVTFDTTQTRVGFEFAPAANVASVTALFFRSGETEPTGSLPVAFTTGAWDFFGAQDAQGIDSLVLQFTAAGPGSTLSLFDNFVFEFVAAGGPILSVEPTDIQFGGLVVGESRTEVISLTNSGTEDLAITAISDPGGDFSLTAPALPLTLGPGQSSSIEVTYSPTDIGADAETITIDSDAPGGSVVVTTRGSAVGIASIQVDPTALDFGAVRLGTTATRSFTVTNSGTAAVMVTDITAPGGDFSRPRFAPGLLPASRTFTVQVRYTPTDIGADAASITVETAVGDFVVTLEGQGVTSSSTVAVAPSAIGFGDVFVGSFVERPITITNSGDGVLSVSRISLRDGSPPPRGPFDLPLFSSDFPPALPITVAPGASKSLMVRFAPTDTVDSVDQVEIETNDPARPEVVVPVTGTGVAVLVPEIDVLPTTATYGGRFLDTTSQRVISVKNHGTGNLIVTGVQLTRNGGGAFRLTGAPEKAVTLEPGAALDVQAIYTPRTTGTHNGLIVITSSDPDEPETRVVLTGIGVFQDRPEIEVEPLAIDFGEQFVGAETAREVVVRNVGSQDLEITGIGIGAGSSADFSVGGEPAFLLVPNGERTISVLFTPSDVAVVTGTLRIESTDADEGTTTVSLEGRGIPVPKPRITVRTPPTLLFSEVQVGTSSTLRATIQNTGVANLNVTAIALGAQTSPEFQITGGPAAVEIVPGAEVSIDVTYLPEDVGLDSGVLRIQSDDEIDPLVNVALLGIGVGDPVAEITVITATPTADYGLVQVGSPRSMDVTILNSGTASLEVTAIGLSSETSLEYQITGGPRSVSIAPGAHVDVEVTYTPVDVGFDSGTLVIESLDPDEAVSTVALSGTGAPVAVQQIVADAPAMEYGDVRIGTSSIRGVTITNPGTAILDVRAISVTEGSSPAFAITGGPGRVHLAPGARFTVEVTYRPSRESTDSGLLQILSDDSEEPVLAVSLSGTGVSAQSPRIEVDRAALDFGEVPVGAPAVLGLSVRNTGASSLALTSVDLGPGSDATFTISREPPAAILQPGGETVMEVAFRPTAPFTASGTLRIGSNDLARSVMVISLSGTGIAIPAGRIAIDPPSVDFGNVDIGTGSIRTITLRNQGSTVLSLAEIVLGQGSSERFAISRGPAGLRLNPGAATTVDVTYTPTFPRADSATLRVSSSDDRHPEVAVSLFGIGVGEALEDIFRRGDGNQDGDVNISDAVSTLTYLFGGGIRPTCLDAADANDDNSVDLSDALFTLNSLFSGGAQGALLGGRCDSDATPDDLAPCEYSPDLCE